MIYEELHNRYGSHVARRVQHELSPSEFAQISLERLPTWLEGRAENAHKNYQTRLGNPFISEAKSSKGASEGDLYTRWQQAEELSYIIAVAEDVSAHAHVAVNGK